MTVCFSDRSAPDKSAPLPFPLWAGFVAFIISQLYSRDAGDGHNRPCDPGGYRRCL
jgi:hypothetical protein